MTNILQDGVVWLGGQLGDHAGVTITYTRGANSVSITATVSMHEYDVIDTDGVVTAVTSRDYVIHSADLILAAVEVLPRAGDRIAETIDGTAETFEVMPLAGTRAFDPVDPDSVLLKIHTKKVA